MYKFRKFFLFLVINIVAFPIYSIETYPVLKQYIDNLVQEVSNVLNDSNIPESTKIVKSHDLLNSNLDLDWMARYSLGRYKRMLSPAQINEFIPVYSKYVTTTYTDLVKNYKGEQGKIVNIRKLDDTEFIVKMEIIKTHGQPPIKVDYFVRSIKSGAKYVFKVSDIITEGISMINSQQAEFSNILETSDINTLIIELKKKCK